MILLIAFAFLAGVITILSPCILPILPLVLSVTVGERMDKSRPVGVVFGFVLSFTFFTLFLSSLVRLSGISADVLRLFSIFVMVGFGLSLLIPKFQYFAEILFSKLVRFVPQNSKSKTGFWSGLLVGLSLGLLWTPCVGPILASVITLAISGSVTLEALFITLAYALGTAVPMFLIMLGGQSAIKKVPWLLANTVKIQKVFGVIMIITALGILNNVDRKFQTYILEKFPQYGVGLTKFEEIESIKNRLDKLGGKVLKTEGGDKPMFNLFNSKATIAPEIIPGGDWFNSDPVTLKQLRGKVVIVDFWTYTCINCQRTFPYLRGWHAKYKDKGLVIIGVHSPEFEFEKSKSNLRQAIKDFKLPYAIVQDNDFATWRAYKNQYWPAKYFVDKEGYLRYSHFGEGDYDESERVIQQLLKESGAIDVVSDINNPEYKNYAKTPEIYLGYARISNLASPERILDDSLEIYTAPLNLSSNSVAFSGPWKIMKDYANAQKGAKLILNFESKEVFLVMRSTGNPARVRVYLDDKVSSFGEDNKNGDVNVEADRLYKIINLTSPGRHLLRLEFEDNNVQLFAFTFG